MAKLGINRLVKARVPATLVLFALMCVSCGDTRLSEAAFRAKANAICRQMNRRASAGGLTTRAPHSRIATIDTGIAQLAKLKPPARDAVRYGVLLGRLQRLLAFAKARAPQVALLYKQQEKAMPRRASDYDARIGVHRFEQLARRITALTRPAARDVRIAGADARALHLPACDASASGS